MVETNIHASDRSEFAGRRRAGAHSHHEPKITRIVGEAGTSAAATGAAASKLRVVSTIARAARIQRPKVKARRNSSAPTVTLLNVHPVG